MRGGDLECVEVLHGYFYERRCVNVGRGGDEDRVGGGSHEDVEIGVL